MNNLVHSYGAQVTPPASGAGAVRPGPLGCGVARLVAACLVAGLLVTGGAQAQVPVGAMPAGLGPVETATAPRQQVLDEVWPHLKVPAGLGIDLAALVPAARQLAVWPGQPVRVAVGTLRGAVWLVDLPTGQGALPQVRRLAPELPLRLPNGVCWSPAGELFVVEQNRVLAFGGLATPTASVAPAGAPHWRVVVPQGQLIPQSEVSGNHSTRVCQVGPDGWLYISLGQPYNVPPRDKLALYARTGIGGILRIRPDGSQREVFATGLRNSVGLAFHPGDGALWFTDNQTDGMGDDLPHGEINRAEPGRPGQFFGYPWVCGRTRITEHGYDREPLPAGAVAPQVLTDAHAADLGLAFHSPAPWPARWQGGLFNAQHGSWNRSTPIGARVMWTPLSPDGRRAAGPAEVFADGWLDPRTGRYRGRPVDVASLPDGSLLVSDDHAGALWRIQATVPAR